MSVFVKFIVEIQFQDLIRINMFMLLLDLRIINVS